jgi:hypothetical protein
VVVIAGGDRSVGIKQKLTLQVTMFNTDEDSDAIELTAKYVISWMCTDMATRRPCQDKLENTLLLADSASMMFEGKTFQPYSANLFSVSVHDTISAMTYIDSAMIMVVDEDMP